MLRCTDQLQRIIELPAIPKRIVSVVPSQTELLSDLELDEEVVGITRFCIHPNAWFRTKKRIGGTKNLHINSIRALSPDLIIANKEENLQTDIALLAAEFPVYISDISRLTEALQMIRDVGALTGRNENAATIAAAIEKGFQSLSPLPKPLRTAYLIWKDPYMTVGHDTFIHDIMLRAGLLNAFGDQARYPSVSVEDLRRAGTELILLSSEPYPFKEKHIRELETQLPGVKVELADGEMFSWYGSRLLHTPAYLHDLQKQINTVNSKYAGNG